MFMPKLPFKKMLFKTWACFWKPKGCQQNSDIAYSLYCMMLMPYSEKRSDGATGLWD